jgi:hypothetical protein
MSRIECRPPRVSCLVLVLATVQPFHDATMSQRPREGLYSQIRLYKLLAQAISALPSEADITEAREHVR